MRRRARYPFTRLSGAPSSFGAFRTWAKRPQEVPRIDPVLMAVVPTELDRIFANAACRDGLRRSLEHRQRAGLRLFGFAGLPVRLYAILVAKRTRTRIPQVSKRIMALVAVLPFDVHALAGGQVDFDGFRVRGPWNPWCFYGHAISIAQRNLAVM